MVDGWLIALLFALGSLPIVLHDIEDLEVPVFWFLVLIGGVMLCSAGDGWVFKVWGASAVLLAGSAALLCFPERIGEGDVLYLAAFPFVLDFFPMLTAVGLACAGGMGLFAWKAVSGGWSNEPVAFTPLLFWGAGSVLLIQEVVF